MNYQQKLEDWFRTEKAAGRVVDLKFFPMDNTQTIEAMCKAVYETVTGKIKIETIKKELL